ncbi:glycosyltransferase family 39 protein [Candidatus Woesearchaeota archaeon]|nr:glycosyltransferase family 39 protein [Candidatus Woesearchaeota archaeon]
MKRAILIILLGTIVRFFLALMAQPGGDGCFHLNVARFIATNNRIPVFELLGRDVFSRPPLFHFIGAALFKVFGVFGESASNAAMKLISPLFGSLTILLVFLISKKVFNKKVALYSTIFIAFLPIHIDYSSTPHVEALLVFFLTVSLHFILTNRPKLSGLSYGLALLTKYQALFILPVLLLAFYLRHKKKHPVFVKKSAVFLLISFAISLPWFIRNYIALNNPIWPYLNSFFGGAHGAILDTFKMSPSISHLLTHKLVTTPYLEFFGVPLGQFKYLFYYNIPFLGILLLLWGLATLVFVLPLIIGFINVKIKSKNIIIFLSWIGIYALSFIGFAFLNKTIVGRYLFPIIPILSIIWGFGLSRLFKKIPKTLVLLAITFCIIGFVSSEALKVSLISGNWHYYDNDFNWIKENTPKDAVFFAQGQCFSYYFNRPDYYAGAYYPKGASYAEVNSTIMEIIKENNINYIWVNQNFGLAPESVLPEDVLNIFKVSYGKSLVYKNEKTGTYILKTG